MTGTDPAAIAATVVGMARESRFEEIERLFAPRLRAALSADTLRAAWRQEMSRIGRVCAMGVPASEPGAAGLVRLSVPVTGEHGAFTVVMSVDGAGAMHGLRLAPPAVASWEPPGYVHPSAFTEREVTVSAGPLAVPGTLSLPRRRGAGPAVVLLAGGGPFDRDETSGVNKPLKDLAWGLASRGVAVVRFDKVTLAHGEVASRPGFTPAEEYVAPAVAAVRLLQRQPGIDPARVFVAGHSMGGRAAPRVAAAERSVAGLVILAGDTTPMHHAAVRTARYLATLDPRPDAPGGLDLLVRQAALVDGPALSPQTPATDLPFGWPASYWLDLRDDDPAATAAALDKPMLILQGGRDYQVTVEDDLAGWRARLGHRPDVVIRVHDACNHLFFPGSGPSTPAEYGPPQHVDAAVVAEIVGWLTPGRARFARFFSRPGH